MYIISPITRSEDVKPLIESGANEFYAGILMNWEDRYHMINSINRRYGKDFNFKCLHDLKKAITIMNQYGVPLFITMNSPYYVPEQHNFLKNYIKILVREGVKGFIVSDIWLIDYIKKNYPKIKIHLSTVSTCLNLETFKFFQNRGVDRIILPRELTITEIKEIKKQIDVEIEAFYSPLDCFNIDGYCGYQHIGSSKCINDYINTFVNPQNKSEKLNCSNPQNCRLCQMYDLYFANVSAIKIIGRGDLLSTIKSQVLALAKIINFLKINKGIKKSKFIDFVQREVLNQSNFACNFEKCLHIS
ncbi:MAG: U32 family peptidase [Nanoarchaeota archaeon]|nr:U32 family peptidase [Nanoarchaeota archaeon]MBU4116606.1 U32 family peptidase [Nanoarchaeota archaeon]